MGYYINDRSTSLDDLRTRLEATDLIPSHRPLLDGAAKKLGALKKVEVKTVADLRARLKSKKSLASLADDSGIDEDYLVLLRRAVEGFFPKPQPLKEFDWVEGEIIVKLEQSGVKNTRQLYEVASSDPNSFAESAGLGSGDLLGITALADLSRVQWVSPTFARTLVAAGFTSARAVHQANPETLYEAVLQANKKDCYYKGKVGLRDIKRLIVAAGYVP